MEPDEPEEPAEEAEAETTAEVEAAAAVLGSILSELMKRIGIKFS